MKRRELWTHIGVFVAAYSGFVAYRYQFDRPPQVAMATVAQSVSTSTAVRHAAVVTPPSASASLPKSVERSVPRALPRMAQNVEPAEEFVAHTNSPPTRAEELAAMGALMSDPDPDVARVARDAYKQLATGE